MRLVDEIQICETCEADMEYEGIGVWGCECGKNFYANWLDGPSLAAWFREVLEIEGLEGSHPSFMRKLRGWETGAAADFYRVDNWLVKFDLHPYELPDVWCEEPRRGPVPEKVRLAALRRVDDGEMISAVARDLGVNPDSIGSWRKVAV